MPNRHSNDPFLLTNLKALLQDKLWLLEQRLKQKRDNTTYKAITPAEARVLAALRGEELTISEVARMFNVSRQAVHKVISGLIKRKILKLHAIEGNSRDKKIVFTAAGEAMKKQAATLLHELEQEVATAIGPKNLQQLKSLLAKDW